MAESSSDRSPGPRYGHEMVYDEMREEVVLFGGFGPDGEPKGDTWIWDGESWRLGAAGGPSPRKWPAAAYDRHRGEIVLHGGRAGEGRSGPSLSDTWIWDGQRWTEVDVDGPTPRDHHRAAYDEKRNRVVLFGGWNGESLENDTWEWNGTQWEQVALTGPSPRAPFGLAYHESLEAVVLAGGQNLTEAFADMWIWNGSSWIQLESKVPGSRGFHAMVYAPSAESFLLFGGRDGDVLLTGPGYRQVGLFDAASTHPHMTSGAVSSFFTEAVIALTGSGCSILGPGYIRLIQVGELLVARNRLHYDWRDQTPKR